jgi:hypothetical protein
MARKPSLQTLLILPLVLLTVALFEDLVTYEVRRHVRDIYLRTAGIVILNGAAFAFAATVVSPWLKRLLATLRRSTRRGAGTFGLCAFYLAAYGLLYYAYFLAETRGSSALLPNALR